MEEKKVEKKKGRRNLIIGIVAILLLCCIGLVTASARRMQTPEGQATATARALARDVERTTTAIAEAAEAAEATEEARPTDTSTLTNSPTPTAKSAATTKSTETPTSLYPEGDTAKVVRVVDGDTIKVTINGEDFTVRYIGMDTPERGDTYFTEATQANADMVEGQTVILVKDVSETDRYNRLLRYVYLEDGTFVNAELVRLGFAQIATYPPDVAHQAEYLLLQQEARETSSGLWGLSTNTAVPQPTSQLAPAVGNCDPHYPGVCIPPYPPDLDCGEISFRRFQVLQPDPHGFDMDKDGIGCETG